MADEKEVKVEEKEAKVAADGAQSDDGKGVPFSDHPRWKEVYGAYKDYKRLGDPRDIESKLNEAASLKAAFEEAAREAAAEAAEASKTPDDKKQEELMKKARVEIKKLFPELDELAAMREAQQARWGRLEQSAIAETRDLLKEIGLPDTKEETLSMSDILADIIKNDADLYAEYEVSPRKAVRGAYDKFAKHFKTAGERSAAADKQKDREKAAKLPKAHGAGGGEESAGGKVEPPKNLKEATERAIERLKGMEL